MARLLRIIHTEAGNATVGSGEKHGDGDNDDAGYEISILPLNDKGIHTEVPLLNLDRPRGSVPVAAEILAGQARIGGRGSYGGNLGCNMRGELDFTCRTKTTVELGVSEGGLVTTPSLPTRT